MKARTALPLFGAVAVVALAARGPGAGPGADRIGSDNAAQGVAQEIDSGYEPWFRPLWTPGSPRLESWLFTAQGVVGAGALAFFLLRARRVAARGQR